MLEVVKQTLVDLPENTFGEFYQEYIANLEDKILEYDLLRASSTFHSIDDITDIIRIINKMTEDLK